MELYLHWIWDGWTSRGNQSPTYFSTVSNYQNELLKKLKLSLKTGNNYICMYSMQARNKISVLKLVIIILCYTTRLIRVKPLCVLICSQPFKWFLHQPFYLAHHTLQDFQLLTALLLPLSCINPKLTRIHNSYII